MKRFFITLAAGIMLFSTTAYAQTTVNYNNKPIEFSDQTPMIINDRTYVPVRDVFETMGMYVDWDEEFKVVVIENNAYVGTGVLVNTANSKMLVMNYDSEDNFSIKCQQLSDEVKIVNDRMMLPLREILEAMNCEINWQPETKSSQITPKSRTSVNENIFDFYEFTPIDASQPEGELTEEEASYISNIYQTMSFVLNNATNNAEIIDCIDMFSKMQCPESLEVLQAAQAFESFVEFLEQSTAEIQKFAANNQAIGDAYGSSLNYYCCYFLNKNTFPQLDAICEEKNIYVPDIFMEQNRTNSSEQQELSEKELAAMKPVQKLPQLEKPKVGDTIATLHTNMGDIKIRLFPEYAPLAVENFVTHAKNGYYNGLTFHRVINNFVIQGGDPLGTGAGGESIWGKAFENEVSLDLRSFRGALCMANSGPDTNGSQFYVVQNSQLDENFKSQLEQIREMKDEVYFEHPQTGTITYGDVFPDAVIDEYINNGGYPTLDTNYTIFGQTYEGFDVVDKIAAVETDANDKPVVDVVIENIEIGTY